MPLLNSVATLTDIQYQSWTMSVLGSGVIAEGLASLRQCIDIILRTSKGTDPMRPFFGSDIYKYQDAPITNAIPNIKSSIRSALGQWEPRILVTNITHTLLDLGHVQYNITYTIVDSDISDTILFDIFNGGFTNLTTTQLTLQAFFPVGIDTKRNTITFSLSNADVLPLPPDNGFANLNDTLAWVTANWGSYGRWFLLADRLVCYLSASNYSEASLALFVSSTNHFAVNIPSLSVGFSYQISFDPDSAGLLVSPEFTNKADMLVWVRANWSNYGSWLIESGAFISGDFNSDFSNDFNVAGSSYVLALYTDTVNSVSLVINNV